MKNSSITWLLITWFTGIIASNNENNLGQNQHDNGYQRYTDFNQNLQRKADKATLQLAKLKALKSVPKEYPKAARFVAETYCPSITAAVDDSNTLFPSVNTFTLKKKESKNIFEEKKSFPWSSDNTIYKKGSDFDRVIIAQQIQQAIKENNLDHIAVAKKSVVKDGSHGWIVAVQGVKNDSKKPSQHAFALQDYSLANSLSLDEFQNIVKLTEKTGFSDFAPNNMNMVRDKNNNNKLTIIDTDKRGILPPTQFDNQSNTDVNVTKLDIIKRIESLFNENEYSGLKLKTEIKTWMNDEIKRLQETQQEPINSLIDKDSKYNNVDNQTIENQLIAMKQSHDVKNSLHHIMDYFFN